VGLLLALVACMGEAAAAGDRIVLITGGIDKIIYLPAILAERLGYFREQALEVELRSHPAGIEAVDEVLAGTAQGAVGFYDHTIELQAKGKAFVSVVQLSIAPGQAEVVSRALADKVRSVADLKGKRLGVTGLGASTHFLSQYLVMTSGLRRAEVTFVPVGAGDSFIAALKQGRIDAGMTTEPTASRLVNAGEAVLLADLRTKQGTQSALGGFYPASCLYMPTAWVTAHKPLVQRLVNAFVKALRYIESHSAEEIAAMVPAGHYAGDRALYVRTLADGKEIFTPDGVMPASGPPTVLRIMVAVDKNVRHKAIDISRTYTTEFASAAR
jgi:NitT/TauT family transport system substrate-binding protein